MSAETTTDVIEVESVEDLVNRTVMIASLIKAVMAVKSTNAVELDSVMQKGDKRTATYVDAAGIEQKLGTVSKSFPEPKATIADRNALEAHLRETRPDELEVSYVLGDTAEVYAVLLEHAPHLLTVNEDVVPQWLFDLAEKEALIPGRVIPGVTVSRPAGTVSVRPNAVANALAEELLQSSPLLALDSPAQEDRP